MKNKKYISVINWLCPICKTVFSCNKSQDCPKCGQKQVLGNGWVIKELENNDYYKLYV